MAKKGVVKSVIIAAVILLIFLPPFAKYQELRCKIRDLDRRIKHLTEETKTLQAEKRRLETDIAYIEKRARERIGVVRKGEIIIKEVPKRR